MIQRIIQIEDSQDLVNCCAAIDTQKIDCISVEGLCGSGKSVLSFIISKTIRNYKRIELDAYLPEDADSNKGWLDYVLEKKNLLKEKVQKHKKVMLDGVIVAPIVEELQIERSSLYKIYVKKMNIRGDQKFYEDIEALFDGQMKMLEQTEYQKSICNYHRDLLEGNMDFDLIVERLAKEPPLQPL